MNRKSKKGNKMLEVEVKINQLKGNLTLLRASNLTKNRQSPMQRKISKKLNSPKLEAT